MTVKLTKVPSKLIRIALEDLTKVEKLKHVKIDMDNWVVKEETNTGKKNEACSVCFAGAVMMQRYGTKINEITKNLLGKERVDDLELSINPDMFNKNEMKCFYALNYFREGAVDAAMETLGIKLTSIQKDYIDLFSNNGLYIVEYDENPKLFKKQMEMLASVLETIGL